MVLFHVVITARYIDIQQRYILKRLCKVNDHLERTHRSLRSCILQQSLLEHSTINGNAIELCKHMQAHARYWAPFLSVLTPDFTAVFSYLIFAGFYNSSIEWMYKFHLGIIATECWAVLYIYTHECDSVVKNFGRILAQNRRFYGNVSRATNVLPVYLLRVSMQGVPKVL